MYHQIDKIHTMLMNELLLITAKHITDTIQHITATIKHITDTVTVRVDSNHVAENNSFVISTLISTFVA